MCLVQLHHGCHAAYVLMYAKAKEYADAFTLEYTSMRPYLWVQFSWMWLSAALLHLS
jgi:hypothetical protein